MSLQEELQFVRSEMGTEYQNVANEQKKSNVKNNVRIPCTKRIYNFCKQFVRELVLNGEERVKRGELDEEDFTLDEDDHVARYDPSNLEEYWKNQTS